MTVQPTRSPLVRALDAALVAGAAASLAGLMCFTFADVVLRYLFAAPIKGGLEITELLMVGMIFSGLPLVSRRDEHVTIDTVEHRFPAGVRGALRRVMHLICGGALAGSAWLMHGKARTLAEFGDRTQLLAVPIAPFVWFMAVLLAITAVIHLAQTLAPEPGEGEGRWFV